MSATLKVAGPSPDVPAEGLSVDRLRLLLQDCHLNILVGAGASSSYFRLLGDIETLLTDLTAWEGDEKERKLIRASLYAFFFEGVLQPNLELLNRAEGSQELLMSYGRFLSTIQQTLQRRRSTLLSKQIGIYTTNVDLAFEVALERLGIEVNDGFSGTHFPTFDLGQFGTIRVKVGQRHEHRSEIPIVNLVKLHGSANWRLNKRTDQIDLDRDLDQVKELVNLARAAKADLLAIEDANKITIEELTHSASGSDLSVSGKAFFDSYEALSIVNPEKTKFQSTVMNHHYYEMIRRMTNELEKENSLLLVIGFSFRDEHLRSLILRAARTNPTLQILVFCYSRDTLDSMQRLLPEDQTRNGNVQLVAPHLDSKDRLHLDFVTSNYLRAALQEQAIPDQVIEVRLASDPGDNLDD